jgi:hypothetical protein
MNTQSYKIHNLVKLKTFTIFSHCDVALIVGHKIYYRKGGEGSFPNSSHGVCLVNLDCLWLIHTPFWLQLALISSFLDLCKLNSHM